MAGKLIDAFAEITRDWQWIHCDPERARVESPLGGTVAHGFLTLALLSHLKAQVLSIEGVKMSLNYGFNRVRFPAPVPVQSRLRGRGELVDAKEVPGGVQAVTRVTIEREGSEKPAAIVETVLRYLS